MLVMKLTETSEDLLSERAAPSSSEDVRALQIPSSRRCPPTVAAGSDPCDGTPPGAPRPAPPRAPRTVLTRHRRRRQVTHESAWSSLCSPPQASVSQSCHRR